MLSGLNFLGLLQKGTHRPHLRLKPCRVFELFAQALPVEYVVSQNQADVVAPHEIPPDYKGLRKTVRGGLFRIGEAHAPLGAVAQEARDR